MLGLERQILAFRHPLAGLQLVKGTRERGEPIRDGALRELAEESGIRGRVGAGPVWTSTSVVEGQAWHFVPVIATGIPDGFAFDTADDGGHRFDFFWWPLALPSGPDWHQSFVRALLEIAAMTEADAT